MSTGLTVLQRQDLHAEEVVRDRFRRVAKRVGRQPTMRSLSGAAPGG